MEFRSYAILHAPQDFNFTPFRVMAILLIKNAINKIGDPSDIAQWPVPQLIPTW